MLPLLAMTLDTVQTKYNKGIDLTTRGEFNLALDAFRQCLQSIPLVVVNN